MPNRTIEKAPTKVRSIELTPERVEIIKDAIAWIEPSRSSDRRAQAERLRSLLEPTQEEIDAACRELGLESSGYTLAVLKQHLLFHEGRVSDYKRILSRLGVEVGE